MMCVRNEGALLQPGFNFYPLGARFIGFVFHTRRCNFMLYYSIASGWHVGRERRA